MESPLLRDRSVIAVHEIVRRQLLRELEGIVGRPPAERRPIRNPRVIPRGLGEPQPPDVLDAVMRDPQRDVDILAVDGDVRDVRWLLEVRDGHGLSLRGIEETIEGGEERRRLLDKRDVAAVLDHHQLGLEIVGDVLG